MLRQLESINVQPSAYTREQCRRFVLQMSIEKFDSIASRSGTRWALLLGMPRRLAGPKHRRLVHSRCVPPFSFTKYFGDGVSA